MRASFFVAQRLFFRGQRERKRGRPLVGASLGIALSLIPLVMVDHVADAMIDGIVARYRETSTYHFQVHPRGIEKKDDWNTLVQNLLKNPEIASAWVERQGYGLAGGKGPREGLTLRALPPNAPLQDIEFSRYIEFDSGGWELDDTSILLGREAARRLDVQNGDKIHVLTPRRQRNNQYGSSITPLTVKGIFSSGYQDLDRTWAFISTDLGWRIFSDEDAQTLVGGKFMNLAQSEELWPEIEASLSENWNAYYWRDISRYLLDNLESTRSILLLVMALIILVAVFNVMTSLLMLTFERRREIGILKCTGTSPREIIHTFVFAGIIASFIGTIFGLGGGLLVAYFVNPIIAGVESFLGFVMALVHGGLPPTLLNESYYLQKIPITIRWDMTGLIGIVTLILATVASWIPASRAAKLRPLDVLRKH